VKLGEVSEAVNANEEATPEEKENDINNQMKDWEGEQD